MKLIERPFVYAYQVPTLAAQATLLAQQVQVNADHIFLMRQQNGFITGTSTATFAMRFADAMRRFRSNDFVNMGSDLRGLATTGLWSPVVPQVAYPPLSTIEMEFRNDQQGGSAKMTMLFSGVGLYKPGTVWAPELPAKFAISRFVYTVPCSITRGAAATQQNDYILQIKADAGFLFTHAQVEPDTSAGIGGYTDLRIRLKDRWGKYYSNDFIPINALFGQVAERPGIIYPGIYMEPNETFMFDLLLNDTGGAATLNLQIAFEGFKVFRK